LSTASKTDDLPAPTYGPRMAALDNDRHRRFVLYLFQGPDHGKGLSTWAAKMAGFGTGKSTDKVMTAIAWRLMQNDKILAAIAEEMPKQVRALGPEAVAANRRLIRDPKHRDHARSIAMVLDREIPARTALDVRIEHTHRASPEQIAGVYARIAELTAHLGVPPAPEPQLIEGHVKDTAL